MTTRFLAAAGPAHAVAAVERRILARSDGGLAKVFDGKPLTVWTPAGTPVILSDDGTAIVVGVLFDRTTGTRATGLKGGITAARIITNHWGSYVLLAAGARDHFVLREPSGAVPVYHGSQGAVEVYASDAALLELTCAEPFRPDLDFIRHWLTYPFLRTWRTGAAGVRELLPGMGRRIEAGREVLFEAWSPYADAGADRAIPGFADAVASLRDEALRTIPLLADAGGDIAVQLSGGLDSSIVAAALHQAGLRFRAVTFATLAPDGDERRFARMVAESCGAELVELTEEPSRTALEIQAGSPLRPPANPMLQPLHRAISIRSTLLGVDALLDGAGGDNVFAFLNTASPAVDAFRRQGGTAALRALRDIAHVHGCTFWAAARSAVRRMRRGAASPWPRNTAFLRPEAIMPAPDRHPWLSAPRGVLPGTADHVRMIVGIHHFLVDPSAAGPAAVHPLLAQPLLELCLRIPTWLWFAGGRDRAVAREAFRGLLPDAILERRRKGSVESMLVRAYVASRPRLERFLLDGGLAGCGLIDGAAVSDYLRQPGEPRDLGYIRLLEIAAAEQWHRSFGG